MCYTNLNRKIKLNNDEDASVDLTVFPLPEHSENPFLNTDLRRGILGFVYETATHFIVVFSSLAAKTYCKMMGIKPYNF